MLQPNRVKISDNTGHGEINFSSVSDCARYFGVCESSIRRCKGNFRGYKVEIAEKKSVLKALKKEVEELRKVVGTTCNKKYKKETDKLIIGDTHIPFEAEGYLEFCSLVKKVYGLNEVIFIGDLIDNHAISYHEKNPNGMGSAEELKEAIRKVSEWYLTFPKATVIVGNHDLLWKRKIKSAGLQAVIMKDLKDIYNTPNWNYTEIYNSDGIDFSHGNFSGNMSGTNAAFDAAVRRGKSVVIGHYHTEASIRYIRDNIFGMIVGTGIDQSKYTFDYAKDTKYPIKLSCAIIKDGIPMIIPFNDETVSRLQGKLL